jgi:ketosteroid isomerase-like protein
MSEENIELGRRLVEAFNARDIDAMLALFDRRIEFHSTFAPVGGVYHGYDGLRKWHRDLGDAWGQIRVEPEAFFDLGEQTLLFHVMHGRGKHSGIEVAMPAAQVATVCDGRVVYLKVYGNREDALIDLGVSEQELEPIEP